MTLKTWAWLVPACLTLSGCAAVAVADAAVTVVATSVSVTAKVVGGAVDLVLPDDEDDDE